MQIFKMDIWSPYLGFDHRYSYKIIVKMYIFGVKECNQIYFKQVTVIIFTNLWLSRLEKVNFSKNLSKILTLLPILAYMTITMAHFAIISLLYLPL